MEPEPFRDLAGRMWEEIPEPFRAGVDALVVREEALPHPDLEGIYTLGECVTDHWPSGYAGEGEVRSRVFLYHGSFRALSRQDSSFDWSHELWETLLHELLHHREFAASEAGLEIYDQVMEENFRRHAGESFDPGFYRAIPADSDGLVRLESEIFLEVEIPADATEAEFEWRDRRYRVPVSATRETLYVNPPNLAGGRLWVVVWRREPWWRRLLAPATGVQQRTRRARPVPASGRE